MKYTQREWDRVVGYGKVPKNTVVNLPLTHQWERVVREARETREEVKRVVAETKPTKTHKIP